MNGKRITISDIARESGASPTTVSLVLRDKGGIGIETRERVLAAAQTLGYERKPVRRRDTPADVTTAAILFRAHTPNPQGGALGVNPFYSWVLTGMEAVARTKRINLIYGTLTVSNANDITDLPDHLLDQDLDGIVVVGAFDDDAVHELLGPTSRPVVVVDGPATSTTFDVVTSDNAGGTEISTNHLIEAGHRHIGLVSRVYGHNPNFDAREHGYLRAIERAGLQPVVGRISQWNADEALDELFAARPELTAIVSVNDQFALDIARALEKRGIRVPDQISLIGFDDTDHAIAFPPGLSTMKVDKVGMGRLAITLLDYRLQWPDAAPASVTLPPSLITRGSVAPPATTLVNDTDSITRARDEAVS